MNEVSERVRDWFADGKRVVLSTLVDTDGPSPRDAGAMFAVSSDHDLAGAISGGCVESTLVDVADDIFDGGAARKNAFGPDDDLDGGPTCGGTLHVVTRELDRATFEAFVAAQESGEPFALALGIDPPYTMRVLHDDDAINRLRRAHLRVALRRAAAHVRDRCGRRRAPAARRYAKTLGFAVTIIDPRAPFAVPSRFPGAEVLVAWPDEVLDGAADRRAHGDRLARPRSEVRRARHRGRAAQQGRLHRRDGQPRNDRAARRGAARSAASPTPISSACTRRSDSTSARVRPKRSRSPSSPRS